MTEKEILKRIDHGARNYIRLFGTAEHMEMVDKTFYSYIQPKADVHGISFVYDLRLDGLGEEERDEAVREIKALHMPVWVDLTASDKVFQAFFGGERVHGQTQFEENDEVYLAMLPEEKPEYQATSGEIIRVRSAEEFAAWAEIANNVLAGGYPDIHPVYHYPLCEKGRMKCYTACYEGEPAATAAILDDNGTASLEFVAVLPEMRGKGLAKAICRKAVEDAFAEGAKIVTVRAINSAAGSLYRSVGFTAYNYAI